MQAFKSTFRKITNPVILPNWPSELLIFIPRFVAGMLLTLSFGADKFGMPWSPADKNLGLFEVIYWFPNDVSNFGGVFAMFPEFFAWIGAFSEAVGGMFLAVGFQTRIAAFLIFCTMLVAIFGQKWANFHCRSGVLGLGKGPKMDHFGPFLDIFGKMPKMTI